MLSKALRYLRRHGPAETLAYALARLRFVVSPPETAAEMRVRLSHDLSAQLNHTVVAGLFTGLVLQPESTWGRGDRASQLLGLYEQEVQTVIAAHSPTCSVLIDIGAADGYYAVGCLRAGLSPRCLAFEAVAASRDSMQRLADANGVGDRIQLHGTATAEALLSLPAECRESPLVLIDIEGGEFALLTPLVLEAFASAVFVIELHPEAVADGEIAVADLCARLAPTHAISRIGQGGRDPNRFEQLRHLPDNERWLLVSENRGCWMEWLIALPRSLSCT